MIQKLGKYVIVEILGEGAMGAVYKAYDEILDRYVAVKTMAEDIKWDQELKLRFYREARSAASLHHPNIVTIHDLGEEGKITYIVMELLKGEDLKAVIKNRSPISLEQKLSIIAQVSDGLNHAHLSGIIHRDIKPGNIHISPSGNVKILDFGIAKIPSSDLTRSGMRLGTPIYMSPEQIRGGDYDERSDLFSTGIVFYELLTYVHPFRDKNIAKTLDNILFHTQLPFAEHLPDAPRGLWEIVNSCLAKEPNERYSSLAEVAEACRTLLIELDVASRKMGKELQKTLPQMRQAAQSPGAPEQLVRLLQDAEDILGQEEKPDHSSLRRLLKALAEESINIKTFEPPTPSATMPPPPGAATGDGLRGPPTPEPPAQVRPEPPAAPPEPPTIPPPPVSGTEPPSEITLPSEIRHVSTQPSPGPTKEDIRGREKLERAHTLVEEGKLEDARECFRQAMGLLGPKEEIIQALAETRLQIENQRSKRIAELMDSARAAGSAKRHEDVAEAINEVLRLEPGRSDAIELRRKALDAIEAEKALQARRQEGQREKALGFKLIAEDKFREGLLALQRAGERLGEDSAIRVGIEEAAEALRVEELRKRVQSQIREASELLNMGALEKARRLVENTLGFSPDEAEAHSLMARIKEAEKAKRRADEIAALLSDGNEALRKHDFEEASRKAISALHLDENNGAARELSDRIEKAREAKRLQDEVAAHLSRSRDALEQQNFSEATLHAEHALAADPANTLAKDLLEEIRSSRETKRRQDELAHLLSLGQKAFLRNDLADAEDCAKQVLQVEPHHDKALELLEHIEEGRSKQKKEQIEKLISDGRKALENGDFEDAYRCGREARDLEAGNADSESFLNEIAATEERRRQDEFALLLERSRDSMELKNFESASRYVEEIQGLDPKNRQARILAKEIKKGRRAFEKELAKERRQEEKDRRELQQGETDQEITAPERVLTESPPAPTEIVEPPPFGRIPKSAYWIGGSAVGLLIVVALMWSLWPSAPEPVSLDVPAQLQATRANIDQNRFDEAIRASQAILSVQPDNEEARLLLEQARTEKEQLTIDAWLMEAQALKNQGLFDESLDALEKIFDIDRENEQALLVHADIQEQISLAQTEEEQAAQIEGWLANAEQLIRRGRHTQAKAELDKVRRVSPDAPKLSTLRRRLAARSAALAQKQAAEFEAEQQRQRIEGLGKQSDELFNSGKYSELQTILDQWLAEEPDNAKASSLREKASRALRSIRIYDDTLGQRRYDEALKELARLQAINPKDPSLAERRNRARSRKAEARATLSIFRLSEAGSLTLNDEPIGRDGEAENLSIPVGSHVIKVQIAGAQSSTAREFSEGLQYVLVYDANGLRDMVDQDRTTRANRRIREEVKQFDIVHERGGLLGFRKKKTPGQLLISGITVEYRAGEEGLGFVTPFEKLLLSVQGNKLEMKTADNQNKWDFRVEDAAQGAQIRMLWQKLKKLMPQ